MNYTKGEWKTLYTGGNYWVVTKEQAIAEMSHGNTYKTDEEILANANLIASAPLLYEALHQTQWLLSLLSDERHNDRIIEQREINRQALARADGK